MAMQQALCLAKCYPSTFISVFLTGFRHFSYQVATQLSSRHWVDPILDPIDLFLEILGIEPGTSGMIDMLTLEQRRVQKQ